MVVGENADWQSPINDRMFAEKVGSSRESLSDLPESVRTSRA
jgi:hypothetical protein